MASPNFRINGLAVGVPAPIAASGAVTATLDSTDGVRQVEWSVASTDETTLAANYTLVQSGSVGQTVTCTALTAGTAAILRAKINGGVNLSTGLNDPNGTNATGKFGVLTAGGHWVGCVNEINENNSVFGWTGIINPLARVAPAAAPVSSVTGTPPIVSSGGATPAISITAASGGAAGSMSAAQFTLVNGATASATASTIIKRDASSRAQVADPSADADIDTKGARNTAIAAALAATPSVGEIILMASDVGTSTTTLYMPPGFIAAATSAEKDFAVSRAMTVTGMLYKARTGHVSPTTEQIFYSLRKNGAPESLALLIDPGATTGDTTGQPSVSFAAGDTIGVQVDKSNPGITTSPADAAITIILTYP